MNLYLSGEFDSLVSILETQRHEKRLQNRSDSAFVYKFLGVIYAASWTTRRKAEGYLFSMLRLDPTEDLSSLGVGDSVGALFKRVKIRFGKVTEDSLAALGIKPSRKAPPPAPLASTGASAKPADHGTRPTVANPAAPAPATTSTKAGSGRAGKMPTWVWLASGGAAVLGVAVTGVVLYNQEPANRSNPIEVKVD